LRGAGCPIDWLVGREIRTYVEKRYVGLTSELSGE
jgi:hypothetical protein